MGNTNDQGPDTAALRATPVATDALRGMSAFSAAARVMNRYVAEAALAGIDVMDYRNFMTRVCA